MQVPLSMIKSMENLLPASWRDPPPHSFPRTFPHLSEFGNR
jgi:hypothetical protein